MNIKYDDEPSFYEGIYNMVVKGLMFEATRHNLTIRLTGGH
jgi:hypothetical protein